MCKEIPSGQTERGTIVEGEKEKKKKGKKQRHEC